MIREQFIRKLRMYCRKNGLLFEIDEVPGVPFDDADPYWSAVLASGSGREAFHEVEKRIKSGDAGTDEKNVEGTRGRHVFHISRFSKRSPPLRAGPQAAH